MAIVYVSLKTTTSSSETWSVWVVYPIKNMHTSAILTIENVKKQEECTQDLCRIDGHYFSAEVYYILEQKS